MLSFLEELVLSFLVEEPVLSFLEELVLSFAVSELEVFLEELEERVELLEVDRVDSAAFVVF